MGSSIRGHQGSFKIFVDGTLSNIVNITKVDINQKSDFMQSNYVGNPIPEGDQTISGYDGSLECEVKDAEVDDFIDALTTNNLNGLGVSDYTFISTENYADGTTRSYVYYDCQFKMSKSQEGLQSKMTKKLDFQCSGRQKL